MSWIGFLDAATIGGVLGSVIPSIIGLAIYICQFYLKVKQKGWKNLNEQDWRELGLEVEKEFNLISSALKTTCEHHCCEHCQKTSANLITQVQEVHTQLSKSKTNLMERANVQVQKNLTPPNSK